LDLQSKEVEDFFIAPIDGLKGFLDAIQTIFPKIKMPRCLIRQIRASLKYVVWKENGAANMMLRSNPSNLF